MFLDTSKGMVSLNGPTSVGSDCGYHKAMNLVMVERWKDRIAPSAGRATALNETDNIGSLRRLY
jgi:hypothetical protein